MDFDARIRRTVIRMRLIDADALKQSFNESFDRCQKWIEEAETDEIRTIAQSAKITFLEAVLRLNGQPTIEQTQIVRCKDCKHWRRCECGSYGSCEERDGFYDADWFCGDAEKKGGE